MKAQKSWDTPVADETRDVSDASEDIHGITDDITDDAESAEVDAEAVTLLRKRHRRMTLLVVVVIVASLVSGFCWRRSLQTGSPVNCSHQTGVADEKDYCYGGFKPLQPSGPQLGRSQAGPYFAKAVKGTAAAYDAVRLAAVGGDKDAVNKSAAKARDLSQQAAETPRRPHLAEITDQADPHGHHPNIRSARRSIPTSPATATARRSTGWCSANSGHPERSR